MTDQPDTPDNPDIAPLVDSGTGVDAGTSSANSPEEARALLHRMMNIPEAQANFVYVDMWLPFAVKPETAQELQNFTANYIVPSSETKSMMLEDLYVSPKTNKTRVRMRLIDLEKVADYFSVHPAADISDDLRQFFGEIMHTLSENAHDVSIEAPQPTMTHSERIINQGLIVRAMEVCNHPIMTPKFIPGAFFPSIQMSFADFESIQQVRAQDATPTHANSPDSYFSARALRELRSFDVKTFQPGAALEEVRALLKQYADKGGETSIH